MFVYQLKISLANQPKPTYRTIQFDEESTFWDMAQDIQTAFALTGFESWLFQINESLILSELDADFDESIENQDFVVEDAEKYELKDLLQSNPNSIVFSYIFESEEDEENQSFEFLLELETIVAAEEDSEYPICIDGKGDHPDEEFLDLSTLSKKERMMHQATHLLDIEEINIWLKGDEFDDEEDDFDISDESIKGKNDLDNGFIIPFSLN